VKNEELERRSSFVYLRHMWLTCAEGAVGYRYGADYVVGCREVGYRK
jgi:hypothetical protein